MSKKIGGLGKGLGAFGLGRSADNLMRSGRNSAYAASDANKARKLDNSDTLAEGAGTGDRDSAARQPVAELEVRLISANPHQPRRAFEQEAMASLADSVQQYGLLQPVLVRRTPKGYELIAGERRLRAAQLAGLQRIPAVVREYNDAQMTEVALIENIQRENLNPLEEAQAYQHLLSDYGLTQEMLSNKVGRSRSHIANFLRLLKLSDKVQAMLVSGSISMGQAKPLLALEDTDLQAKAAEFILAHELSVRKAEELVKRLQKQPDYLDEDRGCPENKKNLSEAEDIFYLEAQDRLKMLLGTTVRIKRSGTKKRLEIDFASHDELNYVIKLLEKLDYQQGGRAGADTIGGVNSDSKDEKLKKLRQFSTTGKFSV